MLTADLEGIQRRACRTILGHQFKLYRDAVGKCNLEYLKARAKNFLMIWLTILEHVISYHLQEFSLVVEIREIHPICPSTA